MKKVIFSLLLAMSANFIFAGELSYVACTNDPHEYNALFIIENNKVNSYAVNEVKWSPEIKVEAAEVNDVVWIQWAMFNDTNFGYSVYLSDDLLKNWKVKNWTSGNDSDNYYAVENDEPVLCHLLKSKPKSPGIKAANVLKTLQDF